jgi:peptide methionine sulfoxide reductase MsrA
MNKIEFVDKFKDICSQLSLELEPYIEYGIKISNDTVNTDKVNISFKSEKITKEKLLDIVLSLFDKFDSVKEFIDNVYN